MTLSPSRDKILERLRSIIDPDLQEDVVTAGLVRGVEVDADGVRVALELTTPACPLRSFFEEQCARAVGEVPGVRTVRVEVSSRVAAGGPADRRSVPNVQNLIAIASGKGGVGKSTVAVGVAVGLQARGAAVGLLDADVFGPSLALMLGGTASPSTDTQGRLIPVSVAGIPMVSIGLLAVKGTPVIWRGPLVSRAIQDLVFNVAWPPLDYLVIDLPPGTGDAQLTVAQQAPVAGVVLVTTPQDVALLDVERAAAMFRRLGVPILGVVENMSFFVCPSCGHREEIFSAGGGEALATRLDVPLLAQIPLATGLRALADRGQAANMGQSHQEIAHQFDRVARTVASRLSVLARNGSR